MIMIHSASQRTRSKPSTARRHAWPNPVGPLKSVLATTLLAIAMLVGGVGTGVAETYTDSGNSIAPGPNIPFTSNRGEVSWKCGLVKHFFKALGLTITRWVTMRSRSDCLQNQGSARTATKSVGAVSPGTSPK